MVGDDFAMKRENAETGRRRDMEIAVKDLETRDETRPLRDVQLFLLPRSG